MKKHISEIQQKYSELEKSFGFLSSKYDQLLNQTKTSNERHRKYDADINHFKEQLKSAEEELEDLAQYLRRDCVEISGTNHLDMSCEEIVKSLGKEMDLNISDEDISTVHPLPTYSDTKKGKIIVKFTRRETKNKFYSSRRKITGRRVSTLRSFQDDT